MNQYTIKDFGKICKKNAQSQRHELLPNDTNVFRIYDRNQEDFPVTVDIYSNYARVQVYSDNELDPEVIEVITDQINRMVYIDRDKIIFSYRAKRENREQHEKTELKPVLVDVLENGLRFKTDLTSYADTGLFLDHINTRAMIKEMSVGMKVLNLFSYTGSFSVYAAAGLAESVKSVDLSSTYTRWAEENLKANGFEGEKYPCICCDATKFIQEEITSGSRYDIIIFDPPSFSNSHKMDEDFDVQRDFYVWIKNLRSILTKNGTIMFSTNLGSFKMDKRRLRGFNVKETTNQLWAEGFVKGRKGTTRSWLMALDDNSLSLDWSDDKAEKKDRERSHRDGERKNYSNHEHKDYREHRERGDRKDFDSRRRSSDRGHRDYSERRYSDRRDDRRNGDYRERHEYHGRDENRDFGERRRDFSRDRRPSDREFSRRHDSGFDRDRRPSERSYDRDRRSYDRPQREPRERRDFDRKSYDRAPRKEFKDKKPYGYDSFRPARSRDDSADFFWNED